MHVAIIDDAKQAGRYGVVDHCVLGESKTVFLFTSTGCQSCYGGITKLRGITKLQEQVAYLS
ncbi:MAG: hypothetical protein P8M80_05370 [Pirellulaceae bacterium]|nr:hypothetical protein [Pirellulaceae bacterium]